MVVDIYDVFFHSLKQQQQQQQIFHCIPLINIFDGQNAYYKPRK